MSEQDTMQVPSQPKETAMRESRDKQNQGFTLVEALIVIAILGIISALAITTYYSQIDKIHLNNDARSLNSMIQLAKMRALSTGHPHGVVFQRGAPNSADNRGKYMVFMDCDEDGFYTDTNSDITDNPPIGSPDDCTGLNKDPRLQQRSIEQLNHGVYFTTVFGSKGNALESIVFDSLGHGMQGASLVTGDINIQNTPERGEIMCDTSGVHVVGGTGSTEVLPMRRVEKDDWES